MHPYVTAGGAAMWTRGASPSATLTGGYRFTVPALPSFTIDEADTVTIRYDSSTAVFGIAGAGVLRDLSTRTALRIDVRVLLGQDHTRTFVDAGGTAKISTMVGAASTTGTSPAIQWSNDQSSATSTLSGRVSNFATFNFKGIATTMLISVGYVLRF